MQTFKRICLRDYEMQHGSLKWKLNRGQEYITSAVNAAPSILEIPPAKDHIVVMDKYWVSVPADLFGGELEFTKG